MLCGRVSISLTYIGSIPEVEKENSASGAYDFYKNNIYIKKPEIRGLYIEVYLTLEQHGSELHGSMYMQFVSINTIYYRKCIFLAL